MSEQYDKKIGQSELEKLGITIDKPKPKQEEKSPSDCLFFPDTDNNTQTNLFGMDTDSLDDIPAFLDRRPKKKRQARQSQAVSRRTEVVTARKNAWTDDDLCSEMEEIRERMSTGENGETHVSKADFNRIAYLLKTNIGNIIEHAGFVYKDGSRSVILQDLLSDFIFENCYHRNLSEHKDEYTAIKVSDD